MRIAYSRFTAFVAVDSEKQDVENSATITQPVEEPDGWEMKSFMTGSAMPGFVEGARSISAAEFHAQRPVPLMAKMSIPSRMASLTTGEHLPVTVDPGEMAAEVLAQLPEDLSDKLQRALCLRRGSFEEKVQRLIKALKKAGDKKTAKKLKELLKHIAPPANIEVVAATWDEWRLLLQSVSKGNEQPTSGKKREGWWK